MPVAKLNLGLGSNKGQDGQVSNIRHINCYVENAGEDAKSQAVLYACPGLTRWDNGSYTGASRGLIQLSSNELIGFLGNEIVSFDQGGIATTLTTLVGSGRLSLARNRAGTPQIAIITSAGQYYILAGGVLTQVTDGDLPTPNSVTYLKGFFVYSISDGRIFMSDLEDGTSIGALAFDTANTRAEGLVRVFAHAGFLYAFGRRSTEIWQADPSLASEPFVFSPIQQDIDIGCIAPHSVAQIGNGLGWVDDDGIVRLGRDGGAQRISNHAVERAIEDLTNSEREAIAGRQWFHQGHEFYTLFSDDFTWTYDLLTQRWHERTSYGLPVWRVNDLISFAGSYIASDKDSGTLYRINADSYNENGNILLMEAQGPISHRFSGGMLVNSVEVDCIMGKGLANTVDPLTAAPGLDDEYTKVLLHFNGVDTSTTFTDESGKTWTAAGDAQIDTAQKKFGSASGLFDGTDDEITSPDHADFNLGSSDFTVDFWFKINAVAGVEVRPCGQTDSALTAADSSFWITRQINNVMRANVSDGSAFTSVSSTTTVTDSNWHHLALVRSGNTLLLFLDGALEDSEAFSGTVPDSLASFVIGGRTAGGVLPWNGWIDEFRLSVGIARWTTTFTAPSREHGLAAPALQDSDPQLMFSYSLDGGNTFVGERRKSMGKIGEYRKKIKFNRLGRIDENGKIFKLAASAASLRGFVQATIDARPIR